MEISTIKDLASIAAPLTSAVIDTWLKPNLAKALQIARLAHQVDAHAFSSRFEQYLTDSYQAHSFMSTLVLQNQRRMFDELYVPLGLLAHPRKYLYYKLDRFPTPLFRHVSKFVIIDSAGMGKSTILKFLFLRAIDENVGIPILIELRRLSSSSGVLQFIMKELCRIGETLNEDFVLRLVVEGHFLFLLDGYDEIPAQERSAVTKDLYDLIYKAPANQYVMTSRPDPGLSALPFFQEFQIEPLSLSQAFSLIRNYGQNGEVSERLIEKLEEPRYQSVHEFLRNPFLISLLFKAYEHKCAIPLKKHLFYRQVYDALFETHDLSKPGTFVREKYSKLDIDDFDRVLRIVAFTTLKNDTVEYSKDQLLSHVRRCMAHLPELSFKPSDFVRDLESTVPLFVNEGGRYLRWAHKSLQEYFAARFIIDDSKNQLERVLNSLYESEHSARYQNVLDLIVDLDPRSFRRILIRRLLREYLAWTEESYQHHYPGVSQTSIRQRQNATFLRRFYLVPVQFAETRKFVNLNELYSMAVANRILPASERMPDILDVESKFMLVGFPLPREKVVVVLIGRDSELITVRSQPDMISLRESEIQELENALLRGALNIDDDPLSPLNSSDFFTITTEWIVRASSVGGLFYSIDDDAAMDADRSISGEQDITEGDLFSDI